MGRKNFLILITVFFLIIILTALLAAVFYGPKTIIVEKEKEDFIFGVSDLEKEKNRLVFLDDIKEEMIFRRIDFLEANLEEMEVRIYRGGEIVNEVPIIIKGDPQGWGGSAVGLYRVMSGSKVSFSNTSEVYMPYALHYYGKYYIHGEPYYSLGSKLDSSISGGCLRLADSDAETIYYSSEIDMPVLVIDKKRDDYVYPETDLEDQFPELSAESYLIADLDSGFVFAEKKPEKQLPIASLTKLMTVLVVAENVNLKRTISITEKMLEGYGSTEGIEEGRIYRAVELFYPLLIESSNDAAEALSYFLGRNKTIRLMNEKAKAILMEKTEYAGPSGFDEKNVSTAKDLFYLARYILNNRPPILEITKGKRVLSFGNVNFDIDGFWNKNVFISDPAFVGGKTGFIVASKCTAVFIFRLKAEQGEERNIAFILLGSKSSKKDTQKAYLWLQKNYFPDYNKSL